MTGAINSETDVLIVGAGPTGLTLAIELARRGVSFELIDRKPTANRKSASVALKARTMEILWNLDLAERFLERGLEIKATNFFLGHKRFITTVYSQQGLDTPYPYLVSLPQEDTEALLTQKLEALSGTVKRGVELLDLEQSEGQVTVTLKSKEEGTHKQTAKWVVGADGHYSAVRQAIDMNFVGPLYPEEWAVIDGELANWQYPINNACVQLQPPCVFAVPLGKGRFRVYLWPRPTGNDQLAEINTRLSYICPEGQLINAGEPQIFRSGSRLAQKYREGRVFLAGDAAHISNPTEGRGLNGGLHDAYNLGWKLAEIVKGNSSQALLDSYDAERRQIGDEFVETGKEVYSWMLPQNADKRDELVEEFHKDGNQKKFAVAEMEITFTYSQSPITAEIGSNPGYSPYYTALGARIGDVDDLICDKGSVRLYELLKGLGPSLFILLGDADHTQVSEGLQLLKTIRSNSPNGFETAALVVTGDAAQTNQPAGVVKDSTGKLHERLCSNEPNLCIIRPDGHLGFRCQPPSAEKTRQHLSLIYPTSLPADASVG
ncbi:hypothetical protein GCM10007094_31660 [Pseudovibrio japonicus]|uniref:FAD-binding domain-containing protein n=1 Tax=Pseudovibrio japonicus TaxID=366534 RepID=A0ABQ3EJE2_9HYPH|nr:FAD-dependent monooxygenase [Pseudovibrio japonicus]GHB40043.1 hypothetical protein GCM10007094_31660 [Pseudovibrio japonicus]